MRTAKRCFLKERKGVRVVEGVDLERLYDAKSSRVRIPLFPYKKKLFNYNFLGSRYGGIGRHASLRGLWILIHPGSSPGSGKKNKI